ncbi:dethiobiotin synthase [Thermodesulfobacteriota bacterium]
MGESIFITAVDTEVGKTLSACGIIEQLRGDNVDVGVYKPVLAGAELKDGAPYREDAVMLKNAAGTDDDLDLINPYYFSEPVTPAHAASMENISIDKKVILDNYNTIKERHEFTVVEGAGGVLVPTTDDYLVVDMIKDMGTQAIVITDTALGRINHTLMTLKVLGMYNIKVRGIIVNRYPATPKERDVSLLKYLKKFSNVEIIGVVPEVMKGPEFYKNFISSFQEACKGYLNGF